MSPPPPRSASASGHASYTWEPAGKDVSVRLPLDVIDGILPEVMRGFTSLPRRGAEVGGLLYGVIGAGPSRTVSIESYEHIECEHAFGPSFQPSERDMASLEDALNRARTRGATVVGWFRSHTRKDLFLDDHDAALCAKYFSHPASVTLLIKPYATRAPIAGFFLWEEGEMQRDATSQEFPFSRRELGGSEPRHSVPKPSAALQWAQMGQAATAASAAEEVRAWRNHVAAPPAEEWMPPAEPAAEPGLEYEPEIAPLRPAFSIFGASAALEQPDLPPPRDPETSRRRHWLLVPITLALLIAFGAVALRWSKTGFPWSATPAAASLPLKLAVQEDGTQLEITWDRLSPVVQAARQGMLSIQDGPMQRELQLSPEQLRDGRVRYSRITNDVALRLEVRDGDRTSAESLRLVAAASTPAPVEIPAPPQPEPLDRQARETEAKATTPTREGSSVGSVAAAAPQPPPPARPAGPLPQARPPRRGNAVNTARVEVPKPAPETAKPAAEPPPPVAEAAKPEPPPDPVEGLRPGRRR